MAVEVTDARGGSLDLDGPPTRVISLAPHLTELVYAAGAGERLVAAVEYSDFPEAARELPRVGDAFSLDHERIARLQPDLILAWWGGNPMALIERLERDGHAVLALEPGDLASIPHQIELLGEVLGTREVADISAQAFRARLADILAARATPRRRPAVFVQIASEPLYTVGGTHLISEVLRTCGARNLFEAEAGLALQVSYEAVLERDPDLIVATLGETGERDWRETWRRWPELTAVREDRLLGVPADHLSRPTPRILDALARICAAVSELDRGRD